MSVAFYAVKLLKGTALTKIGNLAATLGFAEILICNSIITLCIAFCFYVLILRLRNHPYYLYQ